VDKKGKEKEERKALNKREKTRRKKRKLLRKLRALEEEEGIAFSKKESLEDSEEEVRGQIPGRGTLTRQGREAQFPGSTSLVSK